MTAERKLVQKGHSERVLQLRHGYQLAMRDELIAIAKRQPERWVIAPTAVSRENLSYGQTSQDR